MDVLVNEDLLVEVEAKAVEFAKETGSMLHARFGRPIEVEYKDKKGEDPVTSADKDSQAYLTEAISKHFPDHGILGEEGTEGNDLPAADFMWILDPLDGTTNYMNGLPIYAVSIGVVHLGMPVVGALFIPWPGITGGGIVLHGRKGGGAKLDGNPLSMNETDGPAPNRLSGLPASFGGGFRFRKEMRSRVGQVRVTGSIAYEMALVATGAFQYAIFGGPKAWDVAGGALIISEAGGHVMIRSQRRRRWEPLTVLGPPWHPKRPTLEELRKWSAPLIVGNPAVVPVVTANLRGRSRLSSKVIRLVKKALPRSRGH